MKRFALFCLISVAAVSTTAAPIVAVAQDNTRTYDRFKDTTRYEVGIELSSLAHGTPSIDFDVTASVQGDAPVTDKDTLSLNMTVTYDMSRNRACMGTSVDILADSTPMTLDSALPPFFRGNFAIITFTKKVSLAEAVAFAGSNSIEIRVCDTEYRLSTAHRAKLATFMQAIQQPQPSED